MDVKEAVHCLVARNLHLREMYLGSFAMKELIRLRWIVGLGLAACMATALASGARPEPNAFLNKRADSIPQLVQEVRSDDEVADRYARHFGKSRDELIQYFSTLHLARINED